MYYTKSAFCYFVKEESKMKLTKECLNAPIKGINYPAYDVAKVWQDTKENPIWLHFGAGNIFRGFIARLANDMLNQGLTDKGIIASETFDYEIISKIYDACDNLTLIASLSANKDPEYTISASICEGVTADNYTRLKEIVTNKSLQFISFTITEKGYSLKDINGNYMPVVLEDFKNGPTNGKHAMSVVASLLYERYQEGALPIAVVSMDNCSHNGEKLQTSVLDVAKHWVELGLVEKGYLDYLEDETKVSFPWSMIDKITPRPAQEVLENLEKLGFTDIAPITTGRHTYIAPYVNCETAEYLVIEDKFPNGRPALEKVGVYMTTRETVNKVETMKVTTCLNPLHTALSVYGCLLNYPSIASEMANPLLVNLVKGIGSEGMKVVVDPKIIKPETFLKEVLEERLPNKAIPDTPWRIATDTSQKIPVRYGETIKAYLNNPSLDLTDLKYIPLAIAGWLRYLLGVNDKLETMELSSDPMLQMLKEKLVNINIGDTTVDLDEILANKEIFGTDLTKTPLKAKINEYFLSLIQGPEAVLNTLTKYVK